MTTNQPTPQEKQDPNNNVRGSRQVVKSVTDSATRSTASTEERNTHPCITIRWWAPPAFGGRQPDRAPLHPVDLDGGEMSVVSRVAGWWSGC
jgi:hypothetical protein